MAQILSRRAFTPTAASNILENRNLWRNAELDQQRSEENTSVLIVH